MTPKSRESTAFFKMVQNKLHFAAHGQTAAELICTRADADRPFMGLTSFAGDFPAKKDIGIAKNYLTADELKLLNNLVSGYFDFAEIQAMRHHPMHMSDYVEHLDRVLAATGENVLQGAGTLSHAQAMEKAEQIFLAYLRLVCKGADDPRYATSAARAAMRFESLHPHNIAQKTAVMLDHFRNVTARKMGGRARAMLVTASRLHAVRYMLEFERQIREGGMSDVRALVAFSGEVRDTGASYTEEGLNEATHGRKIPEREVPDLFATEFNILIVAEKYQTGFDEPQLHTMFVDKPLSSVKAVQTLSRLNRTAPGKKDTFVLDFVNSARDIQKSFAPFYEATVLEEETDPNLVYDIRHRLDGYLL